jgi:hypothetical protein
LASLVGKEPGKDDVVIFDKLNEGFVADTIARQEFHRLFRVGGAGNLADAVLYAGDANWADYTIEVEAQATGGNGEFDVLFRSRNPRTQLMAAFGGWNNHLHGVLVQQDGGNWKAPCPTTPGKTVPGKWYRVRVEARGQRFKVFLDGEQLFTFEAAEPARGKVGLRTHDSSARFRRLKVTDPAGKVLLDTLPAVPASR